MPFPLLGLGGLLGGIAARFLTLEVLRMVAIKAILVGLFVLVLPVVLYNVFTRIMSEMLSITNSYVGSQGLTAAIVEFTGVAGWIVNQISLIQCFSIFLSALALRYTLSLLRL